MAKANNPENPVIRFYMDTSSAFIREAIEKAGVQKKGAMRILRHAAATSPATIP